MTFKHQKSLKNMNKIKLLLIFLCGIGITYAAFYFFPKLSTTLNQKANNKIDSISVFRPTTHNENKKYVFPARFKTPELAVYIPNSFVAEVSKSTGDLVKKGEKILTLMVSSDSSQTPFSKPKVILAPADGYLNIGNIEVGSIIEHSKISVKPTGNISVTTDIPLAVFSIIKEAISEVQFECPLLPDLVLSGKLIKTRSLKQNNVPFVEVQYSVNVPDDVRYKDISLYFSKSLITNTNYTILHSSVIRNGNTANIKKFVNGEVILIGVKILKENNTTFTVEGDISSTDLILKYPNADQNTGNLKVAKF